jgi:hypothetical protein
VKSAWGILSDVMTQFVLGFLTYHRQATEGLLITMAFRVLKNACAVIHAKRAWVPTRAKTGRSLTCYGSLVKLRSTVVSVLRTNLTMPGDT